MECEVGKYEYFRHILSSGFNLEVKASDATRTIYIVYGEDAVRESTTVKWFSSFKKDHFDMNDLPRSGRQSNFDEDCLKILLRNNSQQSNLELASMMNYVANHRMTFAFHDQSL